MNRFEVTTAASLKLGDRFYKKSDKQKKVLQMVTGDPKSTKYRTYRHWCINPAWLNGKSSNSYINSMKSAIAGNTEVVFLRHQDN
jgi:hypothetical protein